MAAKLWYGIEQEGYYKGQRTLFIGYYDIGIREIKKALATYVIDQIYFGAGGCTAIEYDTVRECLELAKLGYIITLEVDHLKVGEIPVDLFVCNIIATIKSPYLFLLNKTDQIKLETPPDPHYHMIILSQIQKFNHTDTSKIENKKYKDDKVIL